MSDPRQHSVEKRILLGLIGAPIKSSASPRMHESAGRALGIHCLYQLIDIAGADSTELERLLYGIRRLSFAGINVTFPYKELVVDLLDDLSSEARIIGAVNTIVVDGDRLIGHNTDATGFRRSVEPYIGVVPRGPIALIGAGGVGKAITHALATLHIPELRVFDPDAAKMATLVAIAGKTPIRLCSSVEEALAGAVGVINATPIGMLPDRGSPVPFELLHEGMFVSDAVYSPLWTPLLLAAKAAGSKTMTGRDLAVSQAADAFQLFTGWAAPLDVFGAAFDEAMESRTKTPTH